MRAGRLRHHVEVYEKILSTDTGGGKTYTRHLVSDAWASIDPASASEIYKANMLQMQISHIIRIRGTFGDASGGYVSYKYISTKYISDRYIRRVGEDSPSIRPEMEIMFNDRIFDIQGIRNLDEIGREFVVEALEIPA